MLELLRRLNKRRNANSLNMCAERLGNMGLWWGFFEPVYYPIICLKSVCLSGDVRTMQFAILAQSRREMSQTDRILPRYFFFELASQFVLDIF